MIAYAQPKFRHRENVEWREADVDAAIPAVAGEISRLCGEICVDNTLRAFVWRAVRD